MLPQQAIFEKASEGDFSEMSKSVQVCTACQFVKGQNIGQNHSQLGNNFFAPPVAKSMVPITILTSAQIEQKLIFYSRRVVWKLFCNFRPTWSEVIRRNINWQAGQGGTTSLILQISLRNNLRKIACQGKHPCDSSNNICDIGSTIF